MRRDYQRLREQDARDEHAMAFSISAPLHHCTKTPKCEDPTQCRLCSNAARLAVQHYRPIIEKRTVEVFIQYFDAGCNMPHGGD